MHVACIPTESDISRHLHQPLREFERTSLNFLVSTGPILNTYGYVLLELEQFRDEAKFQSLLCSIKVMKTAVARNPLDCNKRKVIYQSLRLPARDLSRTILGAYLEKSKRF